MAKSKEQRAESKEQRAESREQKAESREQRAKSKEQRAKSKEQDLFLRKWNQSKEQRCCFNIRSRHRHIESRLDSGYPC